MHSFVPLLMSSGSGVAPAPLQPLALAVQREPTTSAGTLCTFYSFRARLTVGP
jgi:hypothetical protein